MLFADQNQYVQGAQSQAFAQLLDPGALCYSAPANVHAFHMYVPLNPQQRSDALLIMLLCMPLDTPPEP